MTSRNGADHWSKPVARLSTGRIYLKKSSAAEIRKAVGVTQADERIASRALDFAIGKREPKGGTTSLAKAKPKRKHTGVVG